MKKRNRFDLNKVINRRYNVLFWGIIFLFLILVISFFRVMIIDNEKYKMILDELTYDIVLGESTPRGRILDRNYNVIVDNKMVNTIIYKREKGSKYKDMIELAYTVSEKLELDYYKVTDRALREFYLYNSESNLDELISKDEWDLYYMKKLSGKDIEELKISRISDDIIDDFSDNDKKASYLFF